MIASLIGLKCSGLGMRRDCCCFAGRESWGDDGHDGWKKSLASRPAWVIPVVKLRINKRIRTSEKMKLS